MAKKIEIVGAQPKKIEIVDRPKRRIEPADLAAALGANLDGEERVENLDLIALADIGTKLLGRLRSSGGRPALSDASEICRVPLSRGDMTALEKMTSAIGQQTGVRPSPGQLASMIVHQYLTPSDKKISERSATDIAHSGFNAIRNRPAGGYFFSKPKQPAV